ncbi:MAG TPA: tRNA lysidine(34) synthetase TilS [Asanoa sp.]|nr:tRNA lysidine(34) synthetase TilS [Asanoa sp.]
MAGPAPPVAATRVAVRRILHGIHKDALIMVACSGGADSLALAAATAFVAPRMGLRAGLITIDHALQDGSDRRAAAVAAWGESVDLQPAIVVPVEVAGRPGGPEAAAREARYDALLETARALDANSLLLGHTRDDQAETVLLALARGAGPRGMSAMPERRDVEGVALLRPLLDMSRDETRKACAAMGLEPWEDPHNLDPSYARSRVRSSALPTLVNALGPGVVSNLARTARLLAQDAEALDVLAAEELERATIDEGLSVAMLEALLPALRARALHSWALSLGCSPAALSHRHVTALEALVTGWHGQGAVHLPGGIRAARVAGVLRVLTD